MEKLTIYFDEGCGICKKIRATLKALHFRGRIRFSFAREMDFDPASAPMQNRYFDMYSYDGDRFYSGYDSYLQLTKHMLLLYPLHLLMHLKPVRAIGERIYSKVAESRTCNIELPSAGNSDSIKPIHGG